MLNVEFLILFTRNSFYLFHLNHYDFFLSPAGRQACFRVEVKEKNLAINFIFTFKLQFL